MEDKNYKKCFYCKEEKPYSAFRKDPQKKDGCTSRCKSCINKPKIVVDYSKITSKICVDCGIDKPHSDYHKTIKHGRRTVQSRCIPCMAIYKKNRYWSNHEVELAKMTRSRLKPENVEQRKDYYQKNKEDYAKRAKIYQADEEKRNRKRERHTIRKETDVVYNLKRRLRQRLRAKLREIKNGTYKYQSSLILLGCDMAYFKQYIESKFTDGMCWEKLSEIHIDHIEPLDNFDLTDFEQQKKACHYTNLQPLWWVDNLIKGNRIQEQKVA